MAESLQKRDRILAFFKHHPGGKFALQAVIASFKDLNQATVLYHVKTLTKEGILVRTSPGVYMLSGSPSHVEVTRSEVARHISTNGSRVIDGGKADAPYREGITVTEHPGVIAYLASQWGSSIVERMKAHPEVFTPQDTQFISRLLTERYPLSEQQRLVIEQGRFQDLKAR